MRSESATVIRSSRFCVPVLCFSSGIPVASAEPGRGRIIFTNQKTERNAMNNSVCGVALTIGISAAGVLPLFAMPTAKEIEKVAPIVEELMKADLAKMKQGKCKPSDVGDSAVALAKKADTQAAKYYLLTSAVPYFAKDGKYDRIVTILDDIRAMVPDVPMKELVQLVEPVVVRVPKTDASVSQLRKIVDDFRSKEKSEVQAEKLRQAIARNPSDRSLHTKLAEHMAVMGNWEVALAEFAQGDNKDAARTAKRENAVGGVANVSEVADAWWDYAEGKSKPLRVAIRKHVIDLYKAGIADGKITGLAKVQAERRIAEVASASTEKVSASSVDSSAGQASMLETKGAREFTLGAGVKVSFLPCAAGKFTMGWNEAELKAAPRVAEVFRQCEVTISKPFWMMETLVSERLWGEVMGEKCNGVVPKAMTYAEAERLLEKIKGKMAGRIPGGYIVRLPTYAEYEYVLKAGGAEQRAPFAQLTPNGEESACQAMDADVASPTPNLWGIRGLRMKGGMVWLSDRLSSERSGLTHYKFEGVGQRIDRIDWPKSSADPLVPFCGGSSSPVVLTDNGGFCLYGANANTKAFIRLVLAPKPKDGKK